MTTCRSCAAAPSPDPVALEGLCRACWSECHLRRWLLVRAVKRDGWAMVCASVLLAGVGACWACSRPTLPGQSVTIFEGHPYCTPCSLNHLRMKV